MSESSVDPGQKRQYHDVSVRAVELLAWAQQAADDAIAEAQAYARDLEESARAQYHQILQRAHSAARQNTDSGDSGAQTPALNSQQVEYVRTYARVAHSQLTAVMSALNEELAEQVGRTRGEPGRGRRQDGLERPVERRSQPERTDPARS